MIDVIVEIAQECKAEAVTLWKKFVNLPASRIQSIVLFLVMLVFTLVSYSFVLGEVRFSWTRKEYEWGFIIPFLALIVLWVWRQPILESSVIEQLAGLAVILLSTFIRYVSWQKYDLQQASFYTLILNFIGLIIILGGFRMISWTWPSLLLLVLALPFSGKMERETFNRLQVIATKCSAFSLETLGVDVTVKGANTLDLRRGNEVISLNVAEACAGFKGMLTALSLTMTVVFLIRADLWIKIILVASAIPIALFGNTLRIVVQCFCYQISEEAADFFHDYAAAFVVYPIVFGLLYLEYVLLRNLVIEDSHDNVIPLDRPASMRMKLPQAYITPK